MKASLLGRSQGRWLGRAVVLAGLAAWVRMSLKMLPYCYHDLRYLFSLERKLFGAAEWMHPLYVPFLSACHCAFWLLGYSGSMLIPLEAVNVVVAASALAGLYWFSERLEIDPLAAAAGVLLLGFSLGFWEGGLRPDPYALAAAGSIASLIFLMGDIPSDASRRFAWAGLAAGLTMGFHFSGVFLVPTAVLAAWMQGGRRRGVVFLWAFIGPLALVLAGAYVAFTVYYGITAEYFLRTDLSTTFHQIEQMPGTSIWSSFDFIKQLRDYRHTVVNAQGGGPSLILALAAFGLSVLLGRGRIVAGALQKRALVVSFAASAFCALFFLINNTQNGFVYGALLALPIFTGILASQSRLVLALYLPAAALAVGLGASRGTVFTPERDPMYRETLFLDGLLHPGDVLAVTGCLFPEMLYRRRFDVLLVGGQVDARTCPSPQSQGGEMVPRILSLLRDGRRVYFTPLGVDNEFVTNDISGDQKQSQVFSAESPRSPEKLRAIAALRKTLESSFTLDCTVVSPQGWRYCRLGLPGGVVGRRPFYAAGDRAALNQIAAHPFVRLREASDRARILYLLEWLAESPWDRFLHEELLGLLRRQGSWGLDGRDRGFSGMSKELRLACEGPQNEEGLAHWRKAAAACESCVGRGLGEASDVQGVRTPADLGRSCRNFSWIGALDWEISRVEESAALLGKGLADYRGGRKLEAEEEFRAALEADGANISAWMSLGTLLSNLGRGREAVDCYDRILELRSEVRSFAAEADARDVAADTLAARANALLTFGRKAQARLDREAALKIATPAWPWRKEIQNAIGR